MEGELGGTPHLVAIVDRVDTVASRLAGLRRNPAAA